MKCSVYIATTLDGFIAREDGGIDWLNKANEVVPKGEDFGFAEFMAGVDALVMGRGSFETVIAFPEWFYGDKPVIVLSNTLERLPGNAPATVELLRGSPAEIVATLEKRGWTHLYIDGGDTIRRFLAAGLIDEITVTSIPVLIGQGRRLFGGELPADVRLELEFSRAYDFGYVMSKYRVARG
jgi:dihydrofolate reductase